MKRIIYYTSLIIGLVTTSHMEAQKKRHIHWAVAGKLPATENNKPNLGVAGAFAGISNNLLLIGGGANFPEGFPWEGGNKVFHDEIYILKKGILKNFQWYLKKRYQLPNTVAYGASVTCKKGVICIGGENEQGISSDVLMLQWDKKNHRVLTKKMPRLPIPLTNTSAVCLGNAVYVAGGETTGQVSDKFMRLDLSDTIKGWQEMPSLPLKVSNAVMIAVADANNNYIYLIGGRCKTQTGISELYKSVYQFDLAKGIWLEKKSLPYTLSAGTGISANINKIFLFGGDPGIVFHKTEELIAAISKEKDPLKKQQLTEEKNHLQLTHPGFSNKLLEYDILRDKWTELGKIPFSVPVTTTAVRWGKQVIIPSGEIRAGVRTAQILSVKKIF